MTTTTAEKKPATDKPAAWAPVRLRNLIDTPFYYDDKNGASLADRGVLLKRGAPIMLTKEQWERRTPSAWGVLVGNEQIDLVGVPEADAATVEAASAAEVRRLSTASTLSDLERSVLKQKHSI